MLLSESARVTTAQEARFRIQYPNSKPRAVKIIEASSGTNVKAWLNDLAGHTSDLASEIANADCVVVIAGAGEDAQSVPLIAELCNEHHKTLVALIVPQDGADDATVDVSLKALRPYAKMLVIAHGRDYIEAMLMALRA
jgi:hypothetical protein